MEKCITGANIVDNAAVSLTGPTFKVKKINCVFQNAHSNFAVSDVYLIGQILMKDYRVYVISKE